MSRQPARSDVRLRWLVGGALALTSMAWLAIGWQRLKRTAAIAADSHNQGIRGGYIQAGPYRMFSRRVLRPGTHCTAPRPVVVLVHGLGISSRYMESLALALSDDFQVLAPDLPGYGESAGRRNGVNRVLTVDQLADALWLWLRACGIGRACFVANSFGCQVLAALGERHPEVVERLVLQGPTVDRHARRLITQIWRDWRNSRREAPHSTAALSRIDYAKAGLCHIAIGLRYMLRDSIERRLPRIAAPVLVVCGSRDVVSPPLWGAELVQRLPHGQLLVLNNGTHTLNYVFPYSLAQAIRPFLSAYASSQAAGQRL